MTIQLYEAEVVDGRPDRNLPGHIKVKIPQLYRDHEVPALIPPMYPGSPFGGWQSIAWPTNPDDDSKPVRVIVAHLGGTSFRWLGTSQSWSSISGNPETRAGARSADGRHQIILDSTLGVFMLAESDNVSESHFFQIDPATDVIQMRTAHGTGLVLGENSLGVIVPMTATTSHVLQMNSDGVQLMHEAGISYLSMESGDITKLNGGNVQVSGITIELGSGTLPPIHPYFLSLTYLADMSLVLTDIIAIGAAIPTMAPYVATNAITMMASIVTSLGAGAPYLSTRITGD